MGDRQIIDRLSADGITISPGRVRRWRQSALIEGPDVSGFRAGHGPGRQSQIYSPARLERAVSAARELAALPGHESPSELAVLLFVRGKPVAATMLVTAVQQLSTMDTPGLTVDQLVDARAVLYGVDDIRQLVTQLRAGEINHVTAGADRPRFEDARAAVHDLLALRATRDPEAAIGIAHRLWDLTQHAQRGGQLIDHPALVPVW